MISSTPNPTTLTRVTRMAHSPYYCTLFNWWTHRLHSETQLSKSMDWKRGIDLVESGTDWHQWVSVEALLLDFRLWDPAMSIKHRVFANRLWLIAGQPRRLPRKIWTGPLNVPASRKIKKYGFTFNSWQWHYDHHHQVCQSAGLIS